MYLLSSNSRVKLSSGLLFWREIGSGPNVVFLHGSWYDSSQWLPIMNGLSEDYHCFAIDLPGFGESEFSSTHYSINQMVESLAEFLAALKMEKVYLVGHSLGGWVAASYALKYSDRVLDLILLSPEGVNVNSLKARYHCAGLLAQRPSFLFWVLRLIYPFARLFRLHKKVKELVQLRKKILLSKTGTKILFQRRWAEVKAELLAENLAFLKIPILILQGYKDTAMALSMSQSYADFLPLTKLHLINSGGDNLPEEMPDMIVEEICAFLGSGDNF
ncbi:MAG: alpha/beta hydrolase [Microcoleaceae cyanobacterium]